MTNYRKRYRDYKTESPEEEFKFSGSGCLFRSLEEKESFTDRDNMFFEHEE